MASKDYYAAFRGTHVASGALIVNTLGVRSDWGTEIETPDAGEVADAFHDWLSAKYIAALPSTIKLDSVAVREAYVVDPHTGEHAEGTVGTVSSGGDLPREMTRVLSVKSDVATRHSRGRMFMPVPQSASSLQTAELYAVTGTWYTKLGEFVSAILAGHDFNYGTASAFSAHASGRVISRKFAQSYDIKSILIRDKVHWLRSRSSSP